MKLMDYLPEFYDASAEVRAIQGAIEPEVVRAWGERDGLLDQLNVQTATWGLSCWERALGLGVDVSRPAEYRRGRIMSKLRGQGTTTVALIKNVAESFTNGQVDVIEHPGAYRFDIKFTGTIGIPPNMDDLTAAVEEIKPAHLGYDYIIIYRTWGELSRFTHKQLAQYTYAEIRGGELNGANS